MSLATMATYATAPTADAADNPYELAYTTCSWARDPGTVTVGEDPYHRFPENSVASDNGAVQSFDERILGAIRSWNGAVIDARWSKTMAKESDSAPEGQLRANLVLSYVDPSAGDFLGYTYVRRNGDSTWSKDFGGRCPHSEYQDTAVNSVVIEMATEDAWFTQSNSYRTQWENCGKSGGPSWSYTCSKYFDFEALLAHEFGHAHGLMHPQLINSNASNLANCNSTASRATICSVTRSSLIHRSEQRTLDPYDIESVRYHYSVKE